MARINEVQVLPEGLRAWRKERDWSQKELAERSGVSPTLIAFIETGERQPSLSNALAIATALGVTLRAFATVTPEVAALMEAAEPAAAS